MRMRVADIRQLFIDELNDEQFTADKTGEETIEILGASFVADEPAIFGDPNEEYIEQEIGWYESQSTNIHDIREGEPPAAWKYAADSHGNINSNYGTLIFSDQYYNQFNQVAEELMNNPVGRRATMVYNRPSIWAEYNKNGMSDFICTNAVSYYIRNNELQAVVQMRSNDVVFGYKNDYAWQRYVMQRICDCINLSDQFMFEDDIEPGFLYWQVQNLHVYEKHFHLIK